MLGISVYLSDIDEKYIEYASNLNVKYIFTSLHIPEEEIDDIDINLRNLLELGEKYDIKLIPDISPYTFEKLNLETNDFEGLNNKGFDTVRLDFGYEDINEVKNISKYFFLVMNASLVNEAYLKEMEEAKIDLDKIILMHNFYPRKETGLEETYFASLNKDHLNYDIKTMAFVVGDEKKRLPLYEGLPTLERHRYLNPYVSGVELRRKYGIDSIFIGDNKAKKDTLMYLADFINNGLITIPVYLEEDYQYLYDEIIMIRQDISSSIIRLKKARQIIEIKNNNHRQKGAIVIDNKLAQRYSGEIQIIKKELPYTSRSNNIGWIHPEYIPLLDYIDHTINIKFVRI